MTLTQQHELYEKRPILYEKRPILYEKRPIRMKRSIYAERPIKETSKKHVRTYEHIYEREDVESAGVTQ